jgi:hypothetical protein
LVDRVLGGRGESSITVPVMDGPLRPNDDIERLDVVAVAPHADNLASAGGKVVYSSDKTVFELIDNAPRPAGAFEAPVTALALSPSGALAIGLPGGGAIRGGRHDGMDLETIAGLRLNCPTAFAFDGEDILFVTNGSADFSPAEWKHDLMHRGHSGSVIRINLADKTVRGLAEGLSFPNGICLGPADEVIVTEAWQYRVSAIGRNAAGTPRVLVSGLPIYPARIVNARDGGYWLSAISVRSQLQEFVFREPRYRDRMIKEVDPDYWVAPSLSSTGYFMEPLQAGGVIRLGIHKPWAPTRSYGFVAKLDKDLRPLWSVHSRADGTRHGVTSVCEVGDQLLLASKGKGEILQLDLATFAANADFRG